MSRGEGAAVVTVSEEGPIFLVEMDRPEVRNAVNLAMAEAIANAMDVFDARDDLRVAVIHGRGGSFCSGMDLNAFGATGRRPVLPARGFAGLVEAPPRKPLIAAVEGAAMAGGFEIVLAADLVVAGRSASFGLPEVRRGLVAAGGGLLRLAERLPTALAMELVLTGEPIDAPRAGEIGLVNRVVDDGCALKGAIELGRRLVHNAPLSLTASKQVLRESRGWGPKEMFDQQRPIVQQVLESSDAREGAQAFTERRPPQWQGR